MSGKPLTVDQILKKMQDDNMRAVTEPVEKFLEDVSRNALYWASVGKDKEDVASGVTFSILNLFDGTNLGSPPIDLTYVPDLEDLPDDVKSLEVTDGFNSEVMLHELFYPIYRETAAKMGYAVHGVDVIVPDKSQSRIPHTPKEEHTIFEPVTETSLQDQQAKKLDELKVPASLPNDVHEAVVWLRDELGPDFRLSDEHAHTIAESYMANKGKLEDAVKFFAKELSVETNHLMSISKEASSRASPTFKAVVPKEGRVAAFIESAANIADYWATEAKTPQEAAEGAVGSMMKLLDGGGDIPAMNLVPAVMSELVDDYNSEGIAGWPAEPINDDTGLHDSFISVMAKRRSKTAKALC